MDDRIALPPGSRLRFNSQDSGFVCYTVRGEIGRGASCVVYDASYNDRLGNAKLVRVKECCPLALRMTRDEGGALHADARDEVAFQAAKRRMLDAYQRNHALFSREELTNAVANTVDLYEHNNTLYIVSTWSNGVTLAEADIGGLRACVSLVLAAAKVVSHIHAAGFLYLDLKPENVMILRGTTEIVQLFDFDSTVSLEALDKAIRTGDTGSVRVSYSKGYAPLEQRTGDLKRLGAHSDVYSVGATLFKLLWGRTPTAFDCAWTASYDYDQTRFSGVSYQDRLFREMTEFFHRTLASYTGDRYQTMAETIAQLEEIARLADERAPYIVSTPLWLGDCFFGREKELLQLDRLLHRRGPFVASLSGMGGIGKSALARAYLSLRRDRYDAVLYLRDSDAPSATELLADDRLIPVNTVRRMQGEAVDEYARRKCQTLKLLAKEQTILLVWDNFAPERLSDARRLSEVGWQTLLISRERLPDGLYPAMTLSEMAEDDLLRLFLRYARCDIEDERDAAAFSAIRDAVRGHTLTMELIARQIAKSRLTLRQVADRVTEAGFRGLPPDSVDYVKDQTVLQAPLMAILDTLVEIQRFTPEDRRLMKLLSLFEAPGVEATLFREIAALRNMDAVNDLDAAGWLKTDDRAISLHPMMREYVDLWRWEDDALDAAERLMERLYQRIRPAEDRHDFGKQFPADYARLYALLTLARQVVTRFDRVTPASQRLRVRLLMDAPVDQDENTLRQMLRLLRDPAFLDDDSVLRLYAFSAYLFGRLERFDDAQNQLRAMKRYLDAHPSDFYLSAYHRASSVLLHNAGGTANLSKCLRHTRAAIAAARRSAHPEAKKQLAAVLLDRATLLLNAGVGKRQCGRLIAEATPLVERYAGAYDEERYQCHCISAMYFAMSGDAENALKQLEEANRIASSAPDSTLSYAEHLLDQAAPILLQMNRPGDAVGAIRKAIALCEPFTGIAAYRRALDGAHRALGEITGE